MNWLLICVITLLPYAASSYAIKYQDFHISLQEYRPITDYYLMKPKINGDLIFPKIESQLELYNVDIAAEVILQHWNAHLTKLMIKDTKSSILKWNGRYAKTIFDVIPTEIARCYLHLEGGIVDYNQFEANVIKINNIDPRTFSQANWNYLFLVNFIYSVMHCRYGDISFKAYKRLYTQGIYDALHAEYKQYDDQIKKSRNDIEKYIETLELFKYFNKYSDTEIYKKFAMRQMKEKWQYKQALEDIEKRFKDNLCDYMTRLSEIQGIQVNRIGYNYAYIPTKRHKYDYVERMIDDNPKKAYDTLTFSIDFPKKDEMLLRRWEVTYLVSDGCYILSAGGNDGSYKKVADLVAESIVSKKPICCVPWIYKGGLIRYSSDGYSTANYGRCCDHNITDNNKSFLNQYEFTPNPFGFVPTHIDGQRNYGDATNDDATYKIIPNIDKNVLSASMCNFKENLINLYTNKSDMDQGADGLDLADILDQIVAKSKLERDRDNYEKQLFQLQMYYSVLYQLHCHITNSLVLLDYGLQKWLMGKPLQKYLETVSTLINMYPTKELICESCDIIIDIIKDIYAPRHYSRTAKVIEAITNNLKYVYDRPVNKTDLNCILRY